MLPGPGTMLTTPGGNPTSAISSAIRSALSGVSSAGFITTVFPAARAGPIFQLQNISGKFHGTIIPTGPERLAQHVVQEAGFDRDDVALDLVRHPAEVAERGRGPGDVEVPAVTHRMSGVERFETRQLFGLRFDQVGQPKEQAATLRSLESSPRPGNAADAAATARSTSRRAGLGDRRDDRTVVRIERLEGRAIERIDERAVDEQTIAEANVRPGPKRHGRGSGRSNPAAQISTGTDGSWPLEMSAGSSGSAFSQTSSMARFGA